MMESGRDRQIYGLLTFRRQHLRNTEEDIRASLGIGTTIMTGPLDARTFFFLNVIILLPSCFNKATISLLNES